MIREACKRSMDTLRYYISFQLPRPTFVKRSNTELPDRDTCCRFTLM